MNVLRLFLQKRGFKTKRSGGIIQHNVPTAVQDVTTPVYGLLTKPAIFTISICGCSFAGAMVWQYESMRSIFCKNRAASQIETKVKSQKMSTFRDQMNTWWNGFSPGKRMLIAIIAANLGVFVLWRVPACGSTMTKYFLSSPVSSAPCLSMILSMYSHRDLFHIATNMYVLWSFSNVAINLFGREQLFAVYMSAGVFSGLVSYAVKVMRVSPVYSLGASGAIMGILGAVCTTYPDARLSIVLIGQIFNFSFTADTAVKCLAVFDGVGLLMGWRVFDHAAHLGGLLFGIWYVKYGRKLIWHRREIVMKKWHKLRGKP